MGSESISRTIKLLGQPLRNLTALLDIHPLPLTPSTTASLRIRVICISDTHNTQPDPPPGDISIHTGDLPANGSFGEIQKQLTWISSQPHQYKHLIIGNRDVC